MSYLDILKRITHTPPDAPSALAIRDESGAPVAYKIGSPTVGDYWLCLSDTEPFDPGDGLPIYRPSEIRALAGKGYGPEAPQAVHRLKSTMHGKVVR